MGDLVLVEDREAVRFLTLNRPEKLNALSAALVASLSRALGEAARNPTTRVVVIGGAGRSFCAGYDLTEDGPTDLEAARASLSASLDHLLEIFDLPQPVIARVQGHCLAGGCDLMMMCDLAVAAESALFGQPEIRFGSAVVAQMMPWLIGARRAKEHLLTGNDKISATEAEAMGLINRVVPDAALDQETMRLADQLAVADPEVMRLAKRSINASWEAAGFRSALARGVELGAEIESSHAPEREEFERIAETEGIRAAVEWRDERYRR